MKKTILPPAPPTEKDLEFAIMAMQQIKVNAEQALHVLRQQLLATVRPGQKREE